MNSRVSCRSDSSVTMRTSLLTLIFITGVFSVISMSCENEWTNILYDNCGLYKNNTLFGGVVCGSDGYMYPNYVYLACINYKKIKEISVHHLGECFQDDFICDFNQYYYPVCGSDGLTYSNINALQCKRTLSMHTSATFKHSGECSSIDSCWRGGDGYNPVCASNGYTYDNVHQVECLHKKGADLKILHSGGCTVEEVYGIIRNNDTIRYLAKSRIEWNPVCGKDNVTYSNPCEFLISNPDQEYQFMGECGSAEHLSCMKAESGTTDLRPVCGTDGETYPSLHHLICRSLKEPYISLRHDGACRLDDDPCFRQGTDDTYYLYDGGCPVCGTDGQTYVTLSALLCMKKYTKPCLKYHHNGPCLSNRISHQFLGGAH